MSESEAGIENHEVEAIHLGLTTSAIEDEEESFSVGTKWFPEFESEVTDQSNKIVAITGTTTGTGLIATKTSLKKGATVYCLNRNSEKAEKSLASFFENHPDSKTRCFFIDCDLQDFSSVENASINLMKCLKESGLDILVNNAGIMGVEEKLTKDGFDVQIQTNHLSHFLLSRLLYPLLKQRSETIGESRIVNHSSITRLWPPYHIHSKYYQRNSQHLGGNGTNAFSGGRWKRYHQSKLANSCFTVEMQKKLDAKQIKILSLCAHPGVAATNLFSTTKQAGGIKNLNQIKSGQSQEDGTMGLLRCMFMEDVKGGGLYGPKGLKGRPKKLWHGILTTPKSRKILWNESEKACGSFEF